MAYRASLAIYAELITRVRKQQEGVLDGAARLFVVVEGCAALVGDAIRV
jgi:hypothetical protein